MGLRHTVPAAALAVSTTILAAQQATPPDAWNVNLGPAVIVVPRYPGSDQYRVLPLPMGQVTYRGRIFLGPGTTGLGGALGFHAVQTSGFTLTAEFGVGDSRPSSRGDALAGLDDRDVLLTAGATVGYRVGPADALVAVARGLNDGAGTLGILRGSLQQALGRLIASVGLSATLADATEMQREFGISELEAARRRALIAAGDGRLRPGDGTVYAPSGGLRSLGASVTLVYPVSPRWAVIGSSGAERLSDRAATSPLMRRRSQFSGFAGLAYSL